MIILYNFSFHINIYKVFILSYLLYMFIQLDKKINKIIFNLSDCILFYIIILL
jgi:hypothetical protein